MLHESSEAAFATTFAFYLKSHNYHWNVRGQDFYENHLLFERIYEEVYDCVDTFAEFLRAMDFNSPGTLVEIERLSLVKSDNALPDAKEMVANLLASNALVISALTKAYDNANKDGELGVSNFIQDRLGAHGKHQWMLRSSL